LSWALQLTMGKMFGRMLRDVVPKKNTQAFGLVYTYTRTSTVPLVVLTSKCKLKCRVFETVEDTQKTDMPQHLSLCSYKPEVPKLL
jgi:hypothetical protein